MPRALAVAFIIATPALADETVLWRGTTDLPACTRTKYYKDDLGNEWPTIESAGQVAVGEVFFSKAIEDAIANRLKNCVAIAVGATGVSTFLTGGAAAKETFLGSYQSCISSESLSDFARDLIGMRMYSKCNW